MRLAYCPRARAPRLQLPVVSYQCRLPRVGARPASRTCLRRPRRPTTAASWCCVVLRDQLREQKIKQDSLERGCGVPLTYSLSLNFMADL